MISRFKQSFISHFYLSLQLISKLYAQGFYLPWAMLALELIFGNPLLPAILGMVAGHLYYFLTVLHPLAGGKYIFKTPLFVYPSKILVAQLSIFHAYKLLLIYNLNNTVTI